jgi:acyl-CoA reductase-like NAD-dependent aldehyde dehydrogenase
MDRTCSPGRIAAINPFDGSEVGSVVDMPINAAHSLLRTAAEGASACRALSRCERVRVLDACASLVEQDRAVFADLIVSEVGKTTAGH